MCITDQCVGDSWNDDKDIDLFLYDFRRFRVELNPYLEQFERERLNAWRTLARLEHDSREYDLEEDFVE